MQALDSTRITSHLKIMTMEMTTMMICMITEQESIMRKILKVKEVERLVTCNRTTLLGQCSKEDKVKNQWQLLAMEE